jgi:hypothetical protein
MEKNHQARKNFPGWEKNTLTKGKKYTSGPKSVRVIISYRVEIILKDKFPEGWGMIMWGKVVTRGKILWRRTLQGGGSSDRRKSSAGETLGGQIHSEAG